MNTSFFWFRLLVRFWLVIFIFQKKHVFLMFWRRAKTKTLQLQFLACSRENKKVFHFIENKKDNKKRKETMGSALEFSLFLKAARWQDLWKNKKKQFFVVFLSSVEGIFFVYFSLCVFDFWEIFLSKTSFFCIKRLKQTFLVTYCFMENSTKNKIIRCHSCNKTNPATNQFVKFGCFFFCFFLQSISYEAWLHVG